MEKQKLNHCKNRYTWQAKLDWYAWTKRYRIRL